MISIAIYNSKGGVGKTAASVNLAYLASQEGKKTLLWDLDQQAAATFYYRVKPKMKGGVEGLLKNKSLAEESIKGTDYDFLDILPGDFSTRNIDIALDNSKKSKSKIKRIVESFSDEYDYVIMDCPPGVSLLSDNVFRAADYILFPLIPTTLSLRTYKQVMDYFQEEGYSKKNVFPFFTLVDLRKSVHKEAMEELKSEEKRVFRNFVPYSAEVEKMGVNRMPIFEYSPRSRPAVCYKNIWREFKGLL